MTPIGHPLPVDGVGGMGHSVRGKICVDLEVWGSVIISVDQGVESRRLQEKDKTWKLGLRTGPHRIESAVGNVVSAGGGCKKQSDKVP